MLWKQAHGISDCTLHDYKEHISRFFSRYPDAWQSDLLSKSTQEYLTEKIKPATYNLRLA